MGVEIERKFLVIGDAWRADAERFDVRQGYLSTTKERTVRVRVVGDTAFLTVKGITIGASRVEFEYQVPVGDATQLLDELCERPLIEKTRHLVDHGGHTWEIDEFAGVNSGLVVAEVELKDADERIDRPTWLGPEVTDDPRYFNSNLIAHPFSEW